MFWEWFWLIAIGLATWRIYEVGKAPGWVYWVLGILLLLQVWVVLSELAKRVKLRATSREMIQEFEDEVVEITRAEGDTRPMKRFRRYETAEELLDASDPNKLD